MKTSPCLSLEYQLKSIPVRIRLEATIKRIQFRVLNFWICQKFSDVNLKRRYQLAGWWYSEASWSECHVRSEALYPIPPILNSGDDYHNSVQVLSNSCYQITMTQWCLKITTISSIVFVLIPTIDLVNAIEFAVLWWYGRLIKLQAISH